MSDQITIAQQSTLNPYETTVSLLSELISIPALSGQEDQRAELIAEYLTINGVNIERKKNNVWAYNKYYDPSKSTILLNSHLDTVPPNKGYTRDPYTPEVENGKLFGLGSNDAGACLVCLLNTFLHYFESQNLNYNLLFAATAEEEISGKNGIELIYPELEPVSFAIVGEPTEMQVAIAEKGLLVVDCIAHGVSGHAARDIGENAIYKAMADIQWIRSSDLSRESKTLGKVKMSVTAINGGKQHNVIPESCNFTIDIRVTDQYTHEEIIDFLRSNLKSEVHPRSTRLRSSSIPSNHPIIKAADKIGCKTFGSATTSDQALISAPSIKMGPGNSLRSHTADEFIYLEEIKDGIQTYIQLLNEIIL